jgi:cellulose synthase/poly-beta-1,6-N-acetylglucosamine synthase-like glycosyltransferase
MVVSKIVVGVCAYNEGNNIRNLLLNLVEKQNLPKDCRILVVCSGCTDKTPLIVKDVGRKDVRIEAIIEGCRRGKANALNSVFKIAKESADVLVLVNADALPKRGSITKLISKLANSEAGAVFAQPVPFNTFRGVCYGIVNVIWRLHHSISLRQEPKLSGELCAIRTSCLEEVPENIATDEPYIEFAIRRQGYDILYVPEAVVYIRCPTNTIDLLRQRRRIVAGHMQLQEATNFKVSTASFRNVLRAVPTLKLGEVFYVFLGTLLEVVAYSQARIVVSKDVIPYMWEPIESTKIRL